MLCLVAAIADVRAVALSVPLARPTRIATRTVLAREFVLVRVEGDDGVQGVGYTYAGTVGGRIVRDAVRECLRPLLLGEDPDLIERHWAAMYQDSLLIGRRGALLRAISAVDIALWDRLGKVAGLPLYRLLGAHRDDVACYASGGYYRDEETRSPPWRRRWSAYVGARLPGRQDQGRGGAARGGRGARRAPRGGRSARTARLALDANNAYRSVPEALRAARAFEPYDPWWFEEPLSPDAVAGHAALARQLEMPVATGEIHQTRWEFRDLLEREAARHPPAGRRRAGRRHGVAAGRPRRARCSTSPSRPTGTPTCTCTSRPRPRTASPWSGSASKRTSTTSSDSWPNA